jgi:DNA-binding FadR family transcriptional regulator
MTHGEAPRGGAIRGGEQYAPRVRRSGLHSAVVADLGLRIVRGDYAQGQVLPRADELAAELGVSRTVVRECLRVLTEKGLLVARQRAGTRVRPRSEWNLVDPEVIRWQRQAGPDLQFFRDLTEVRSTIEVQAARLAAGRATPAELQRMHVLLAEMEQQLGDRDAYIRADLELHATILRATHNVLLAQLSDTIAEGLVASRDVTVRSDGSMEGALAQHADVIAAIASRNIDEAATTMDALVQRALADIEMILGGGS